jgi:glycerophosphoryl diester phosphodiesterase
MKHTATVVSATLVVAVATGLAVMGLPAPSPAAAAGLRTVEVKAHRGGPLAFKLPEESLALLTRAAASGVAWVESDVVYTADGVAVLQHGDAIGGGDSGRSTCGADTGRAIHTMTWAEVAPVRCSYAGVSKPIARLDEVVAMLARYPGVKVELEVKTYPGQSPESMNDWMKRTLLATASLHPRMAIDSFVWRSVAATVAEHGPDVYFLALESARKMWLATNDVYATLDQARKLGVDGIGYTVNLSDESVLAYQRALGLGVHLHNLVTDEQFRFALGNGQQVLGTDDPSHVTRLVTSLKGKRPTARYRTTLLKKSKKVLSGRLAGGAAVYRRVMEGKGLVPAKKQNQLAGIRLKLTVVAKKSSGAVEVAPHGSRVGRDGRRIQLRKGTHRYVLYVSPGNAGKVRVLSTSASSVKLTLTVTGYRKTAY